MKTLQLLIVILSFSMTAQAYTMYQEPQSFRIYSTDLKDSVEIEIRIPKDMNRLKTTELPVIYLLDQQLSSNYSYNMSTIEYLSSLNWIPPSLVVGITFSRNNRNAWTNPNKTGGKADDLIQFITRELETMLRKNYTVSNFHLLVGHSRTAIFSSYALSKRPDFFTGVIASSISNFDFGDAYQQAQFEDFLKQIESSSHKYYYYFSVGKESFGDLHEESVDILHQYLSSKVLPKNLEWHFYKHEVSHELTPGLTVSRALSSIFKEYGRRIDTCFEIAKKTQKNVPWAEYMGLYASISKDLDMTIEPMELFYNSIASDYYNDYHGIYGDKKLAYTLEILLKAIEKYPREISYYTWIGEIHYTLQEFDEGNRFLDKATKLLKSDTSISDEDREYYEAEIKAIQQQAN